MSSIEDVEKHILKKYEVQQKLGKGAYGIVWKALEKKTKQTVRCDSKPASTVCVRAATLAVAATCVITFHSLCDTLCAGGTKKDFRCVSERDGCTAHVPRNHLSAANEGAREYRGATRRAQGGE